MLKFRLRFDVAPVRRPARLLSPNQDDTYDAPHSRTAACLPWQRACLCTSISTRKKALANGWPGLSFGWAVFATPIVKLLNSP